MERILPKNYPEVMVIPSFKYHSTSEVPKNL